jgi:hypothetical protein
MDYWDTAVERGSTGYGASPKKNWSNVSGKHNFPLQRRVAPTVNR